MANVTVTTAANFIPEIWAQTALEALRNRIVLAGIATSDSDVGPFTMGDILHIPVPGTFTVNNKIADQPVTLQVPTDTHIDVPLDKHKEVSFLVEDVVRAQQNQDVMARYVRNAVTPLAEAIESDLFALYTTFSGSVGTSANALEGVDILAGIQLMMEANVDMTQLAMVASPQGIVQLLTDTDLAPYFSVTQPQAIRQGEIGPLYGATLYASNLVPVVQGPPISHKNMLVTPDFAVLAMRGMPTDGMGVDQQNYADPGSNLVFRMTTSYSPSYLGVQITFDVLYGVSELRDEAGVVVLS